jgi:hypothetical protein
MNGNERKNETFIWKERLPNLNQKEQAFSCHLFFIQ